MLAAVVEKIGSIIVKTTWKILIVSTEKLTLNDDYFIRDKRSRKLYMAPTCLKALLLQTENSPSFFGDFP